MVTGSGRVYLGQHVLHISPQPLTPKQSVCSLLSSIFAFSVPTLTLRGVYCTCYCVAIVCVCVLIKHCSWLRLRVTFPAVVHSSFLLIHPTSRESYIRPPLKEQLFELNIHLFCLSTEEPHALVVTPYPVLLGMTIICGMWLFWIRGARSRLPPSSASVLLPTGACSGGRASLFPCHRRIMMKTCSAAVTCEDVFHLNL